MIKGGGLAAWLLACLVLLACVPAAAGGQATAAQGVLRLASVPQAPVPLQGEWGFVAQRFVAPGWERLPAGGFAPVPSSWNELAGKPPGPDGWGSYLLRVDCPAGASLAVEAIGQRTASRLFVNGTEVAAHGEPGPARAASHAAVHTRTPITPEFACPLRLTLHVSNFDHRGGGFVRPMYLGTSEALQVQRESRLIWHAALVAVYLATGMVALIFFAARRRDRLPLVFGLFCIAMAVYTDMIGERLLLRPLAAQPSWYAYMRVEYLSWLAAMALFLLTLRGLFPGEIHRRVVHGVLGTLGAAALAVLVLRPGLYSHLVVPGQAIAVAVAGYLVVAMVRAGRHSGADARVLLAGMLGVLATLAIDLLLIDAPGPDRKFSPFGFAFFLLSPAVVIARRMSHALNAEERARTLEENARLREDVERMSRHDLKTPLNSILGVTRLLRDDDRLDTEQRELVGVLQRAALRMLEMVNLSLGLLRMETGTYDFRPQAVDLREVVTRVLVDLHACAEANAVTLNRTGSAQAPVYVRGEELLCYSIVANLVKNAIEACGRGQQVTVALQPGDPVRLEVHNPGEVPPEVARRFFDKYVTSGKSGGTGLGTYSARTMARAQQGDLRMQTGPAGTTVTLALAPLRGEPPQPLPAAVAQADAAQWLGGIGRRDVLLVDDDEYTRLVNRRFLPNPPFSVETAANGQAATEAMARRWPHYLVVDLEMPVMDGVETVRWVRGQEAAPGRPRCRILMISGRDDADAAERALAAGADRFLVKPVSKEALLSALRELEAAAPAPLAGGPAAAAPVGSPDDEIVLPDGDWEEFFPDFLQLQREAVEAMARALLAGDREDVRFLAHRAAGGLATIGMTWAAAQARCLERDAAQAPGDELRGRIDGLREHLRKVRLKTG